MPLEKPIDFRQLNQTVLKTLARHPDLVAVVDDWILMPDRKHLVDLIAAGKVLEKIQPFPRQRVWRGFDPASSYQDTMGLSKDWILWRQALKHEVGERFEYTQQHPMSFATDLDIAQAFGRTVVEIDLTVLRNSVVWVSDELSALISDRRNIQPVTQREVIVLPHGPLSFTIYQK